MRNDGNYTIAAERKFWNTQRRLYNIYSGNLPSSAHKIIQMLGGDDVDASQCMLECFLAAFAAQRCDGVDLVASM